MKLWTVCELKQSVQYEYIETYCDMDFIATDIIFYLKTKESLWAALICINICDIKNGNNC